MHHVLFWDIDGTLLTTGRAGIFAWEAAVERVSGVKSDLAAFQTAGLTDMEIAQALSERHGTGKGSDTQAMVKIYEEALPGCLPLRKGRVLPGARENLEYLRGQTHVLPLLLTGNTRAGAAAKLHHYGLDGFFAHGAYGDEAPDRTGVATRAMELARELLGEEPRPERTYVIGDTPYDIACGDAIGARTVAVASGGSTREQLQEHGPWLLLDRLPEPSEFASLLGLPTPEAP